jgi:hypothetical protein
MKLAEMSSIPHTNMADIFADLTEGERIEKALLDCAQENGLTAWTTGLDRPGELGSTSTDESICVQFLRVVLRVLAIM